MELQTFQIHINTNSCHYSSNTEAAEECQSKHFGNLQGTFQKNSMQTATEDTNTVYLKILKTEYAEQF